MKSHRANILAGPKMAFSGIFYEIWELMRRNRKLAPNVLKQSYSGGKLFVNRVLFPEFSLILHIIGL